MRHTLRRLAAQGAKAAAVPRRANVNPHAHAEHEMPGYHVPTSFGTRALLTAGSALGLLLTPSRGDLLTVLTQTSSMPVIARLLEQMRSTHEGRRLLITRPSLNSATVDLDELKSLPDGTFGREWVSWLAANHVGPDGRCDAHYMPNLETRYVIQRYRETHDFYHVLLGMPTSTLGETVVKYFELAHMHLPVAGLSAVGGSLRILNDDLRRGSPVETNQLSELAQWAWRLGRNVRVPLIALEWERRMSQPLDELREELGISEPAPVVLDTAHPRVGTPWS
ncbi:Ubiquinone biosynthesis protein [Malassezia cuniculi]|uniref:4-hydroxy-3-methoxy-5-polyprenylbenzoate decarboxylase n=1 Tax=Malassezia cuniculi TaxID=948313 RepID=A0AAF0J502_9BASI|nr:Ubiquinone biosynthesis protein [Malassezia cuniculi]